MDLRSDTCLEIDYRRIFDRAWAACYTQINGHSVDVIEKCCIADQAYAEFMGWD